MPKLGVNIDHVATIRQARKTILPDPVKAAYICEKAGADSIVCHLRQDRRHIQDKDVYILRKTVKTKFNLEMSTIEEIVKIALKIRPDEATLVPEKRKELTTEGGLDVVRYKDKIRKATDRLLEKGVFVSLFIDPDKRQIDASKDVNVPFVELHTGAYANVNTAHEKNKELKKIKEAVRYAKCLGLKVNAGHGLDYDNVGPIAKIPGVEELNIGFSIIARAVFTGLDEAVTKMRKLIE
ncbi:MAG: pyridoxine 5'-phosphate synthase [Candidatus Omnitrophota bacterium]